MFPARRLLFRIAYQSELTKLVTLLAAFSGAASVFPTTGMCSRDFAAVSLIRVATPVTTLAGNVVA
jgi:hypothetical protein